MLHNTTHQNRWLIRTRHNLQRLPQTTQMIQQFFAFQHVGLDDDLCHYGRARCACVLEACDEDLGYVEEGAVVLQDYGDAFGVVAADCAREHCVVVVVVLRVVGGVVVGRGCCAWVLLMDEGAVEEY